MDVGGPIPILSPKEREVLKLVAEGFTSKEIGQKMGISPRTADVHRHNLIRKLGLRNRVEAVKRAMELGIIPAIRGPVPVAPPVSTNEG